MSVIVFTGCILTFITLVGLAAKGIENISDRDEKESERLRRQKEIFESNTYDGEKFNSLNDIYAMKDGNIFHAYEIIDFTRSVRENCEVKDELITIDDFNKEDIYLVVTYDEVRSYENGGEILEEKADVLEHVKSEPLTLEEMIKVSDSIMRSRKHERALKRQREEIERQKAEVERLKEREERIKLYQKANNEVERYEYDGKSINTVIEYNDDLEKEKEENEREIKRHLQNISDITKRFEKTYS
ncbi:hypothetical protein ACR56S_03850 [Staphylococcus hominis]|uniref:hypothetical protein n=1 Tax=Staphylococcus hominis TaxID=1290 RepID=UPI003DA1624F